MNYTVKGRFYIADDGYVFYSKLSGVYSKRVALPNPEFIDNYNVIPEPIPEETHEPETETQATETDYINALENLGVNFNE